MRENKMNRTIKYRDLRRTLEAENRIAEASYLFTSIDNAMEIASVLEELSPLYDGYRHLQPSWHTAKILYYLERE